MGIAKPPDYPSNQHPDSPDPPDGREIKSIDNLYPIEITYDILKQGTLFCIFNCSHGLWTKANVISYAKSIGINEKYANENIYNIGTKLRKSKTKLSLTTIKRNVSFPSHWTCVIELDQCIDTPMHHIFQGVVKSIMDLTIDWLSRKDRPQYKQFGDYIHKTMSHISNLSLDWCRLETFTGDRN